MNDCFYMLYYVTGKKYLALVLSHLEPSSLGVTPSPKVDGVRSCSSQRPLRRMLTDRLLAHSRMQLFSPSCRITSEQKGSPYIWIFCLFDVSATLWAADPSFKLVWEYSGFLLQIQHRVNVSALTLWLESSDFALLCNSLLLVGFTVKQKTAFRKKSSNE